MTKIQPHIFPHLQIHISALSSVLPTLFLTFRYGRKQPPPDVCVPDVAANRAAVFVAHVPIRVGAEDTAALTVAHVSVPVISVCIIGRWTRSNATSVGVAVVITVAS